MAALLYEQVDRLASTEREMVGQCCERPPEATALNPAWLDVDHAVDQYCRERGLAKPVEPWQLMELHLEALSTWSNNFYEKENT